MRKHPIILLLVLVVVGFSICAGLTGGTTRIYHVRLTAAQHHSSRSQPTHRFAELRASSTSAVTTPAMEPATDLAGRSAIRAIVMAHLENSVALAGRRARFEQLAARRAHTARAALARAEARVAALRAAHVAAVARAEAHAQASEEAHAAAHARAEAAQAQEATTPLSQQFAELRLCESGGNYADNTGNGYYGAYQFALSTWAGLGYGGLPSQASPATQNQAAEQLQAADGWSPWPACSAALGL